MVGTDSCDWSIPGTGPSLGLDFVPRSSDTFSFGKAQSEVADWSELVSSSVGKLALEELDTGHTGEDQSNFHSESCEQQMDPREPTSEEVDNSNTIRGQPWQCPQPAKPIGECISAANPIPVANSGRCSKCHESGLQVKYCTSANGTVKCDAAQFRDPGAHPSNSQPRMDHQTPTSEGDYSNAFRGQPCQSLQPGNPIGDGNLAAKSDRYYECREFGHCAKDCPLVSVRPQCNAAQSGDAGAHNFPEILCLCGGGVCLILTSHTEKNPGRKFYRCPGKGAAQCKFFQWCDAAQSGDPGAYNIPEILCPCGGGVCLILTSHTEKNPGRKFYKCPEGAAQCKFFQWCDEPVSSLSQNSPGGGGGEFRRQSTTPTQISPVAAGGGFRGQSEISTQSSPVTAGEFTGQPANSTQKSLPGGFRGQPINPTQNSPAGGGWFRGQPPTPSTSSNVKGIVNGYDYTKKCPCGAGPCPVRCARTDKNIGGWFVTCPVRKGEGSCGFFEWRDDLVSTNIPLPDTTNDFTPKHEGGNSGRNGAYPCFNCGKEGHWKKDCPQLKGYLNS